jgi:hypothetical protein
MALIKEISREAYFVIYYILNYFKISVNRQRLYQKIQTIATCSCMNVLCATVPVPGGRQTPRRRVFPKKLTVAQVVKKYSECFFFFFTGVHKDRPLSSMFTIPFLRSRKCTWIPFITGTTTLLWRTWGSNFIAYISVSREIINVFNSEYILVGTQIFVRPMDFVSMSKEVFNRLQRHYIYTYIYILHNVYEFEIILTSYGFLTIYAFNNFFYSNLSFDNRWITGKWKEEITDRIINMDRVLPDWCEYSA